MSSILHKASDSTVNGMVARAINRSPKYTETVTVSTLPLRTMQCNVVQLASQKAEPFSSLAAELQWDPVKIYGNSKLALIMMGEMLRQTEQCQNGQLTVSSLHPGGAATGIFRELPDQMRDMSMKMIEFFYKTPWLAAQTSLYLAAHPEAEGSSVEGGYFDCCEKKPFLNRLATDPIALRELHDITTAMLSKYITKDTLRIPRP